jgi:hypothetical protein
LRGHLQIPARVDPDQPLFDGNLKYLDPQGSSSAFERFAMEYILGQPHAPRAAHCLSRQRDEEISIILCDRNPTSMVKSSLIAASRG